jgi:ankyrin repeat protein
VEEYKADTNAMDKNGWTPFDRAKRIKRENVVRYLKMESQQPSQRPRMSFTMNTRAETDLDFPGATTPFHNLTNQPASIGGNSQGTTTTTIQNKTVSTDSLNPANVFEENSSDENFSQACSLRLSLDDTPSPTSYPDVLCERA